MSDGEGTMPDEMRWLVLMIGNALLWLVWTWYRGRPQPRDTPIRTCRSPWALKPRTGQTVFRLL